MGRKLRREMGVTGSKEKDALQGQPGITSSKERTANRGLHTQKSILDHRLKRERERGPMGGGESWGLQCQERNGAYWAHRERGVTGPKDKEGIIR